MYDIVQYSVYVQYSTESTIRTVQYLQYSTYSTVRTVQYVQYSTVRTVQYVQYSTVRTVKYLQYSTYSTVRTVPYVQYSTYGTVQYNTVHYSTLQKGTSLDQNSTARYNMYSTTFYELHSFARGPREVGFMSDRQLSSPSLVVLGSLGHVCLTDRDCITKDAVCRQSGICPAPIFIRKKELLNIILRRIDVPNATSGIKTH
jgi:hypothetical protein